MNEDVTPFLSSWLRNVRENQDENGCVMITTPYTKMYHAMVLDKAKDYGDSEANGVAGWSDAIVWVPYDMYKVTGNTLVLKENYDAMKKWCDYIIRTAKEKRGSNDIPDEYDQYLWNTGFHFGEWLVPSRPGNAANPFEICKESSFYIAPFFGFQTMVLMSEVSKVLGKTEEQIYYKTISERMKNSIQQGLMLPDKLLII